MVSSLKKRAAEFQPVLRAIWINYFDCFLHFVKGMISGSREIVPGGQGGVTFQEIAVVFIQSDFGTGFLNTFS